eukprot:TRINITY_DN6943_c0_g1_i1.p1 TRINITY_DN6943_c0_g1~~TRINITY_DN6943_c0_g1_i1.p1  ORF type:complete len:657 (-),score=154.48 TRINITY_DN6943_c0_g1_i1:576-2546(-)
MNEELRAKLEKRRTASDAVVEDEFADLRKTRSDVEACVSSPSIAHTAPQLRPEGGNSNCRPPRAQTGVDFQEVLKRQRARTDVSLNTYESNPQACVSSPSTAHTAPQLRPERGSIGCRPPRAQTGVDFHEVLKRQRARTDVSLNTYESNPQMYSADAGSNNGVDQAGDPCGTTCPRAVRRGLISGADFETLIKQRRAVAEEGSCTFESKPQERQAHFAHDVRANCVNGSTLTKLPKRASAKFGQKTSTIPVAASGQQGTQFCSAREALEGLRATSHAKCAGDDMEGVVKAEGDAVVSAAADGEAEQIKREVVVMVDKQDEKNDAAHGEEDAVLAATFHAKANIGGCESVKIEQWDERKKLELDTVDEDEKATAAINLEEGEEGKEASEKQRGDKAKEVVVVDSALVADTDGGKLKQIERKVVDMVKKEDKKRVAAHGEEDVESVAETADEEAELGGCELVEMEERDERGRAEMDTTARDNLHTPQESEDEEEEDEESKEIVERPGTDGDDTTAQEPMSLASSTIVYYPRRVTWLIVFDEAAGRLGCLESEPFRIGDINDVMAVMRLKPLTDAKCTCELRLHILSGDTSLLKGALFIRKGWAKKRLLPLSTEEDLVEGFDALLGKRQSILCGLVFEETKPRRRTSFGSTRDTCWTPR